MEEDQTTAAENFVRPGAWVSTVVLVELVWVLSKTYQLTAGEVADSIEILLDHRAVTIQDADAVENALALFRARPSLRFADCLILELARAAGHLPLGTFDRRLAKADGAQRI
jgi:predicted nucleic-acid-binding protein